ncbi:MAG: nucleotidyltransferase family protein [Verrucomicrobia bacterium]|nr:nucleotidyltransferase family protein [Verrucomicrobiota bacterium]
MGVLILAAGSSRRMQQPKLLLLWGDTSVLGHQIRIWQRLAIGQIAVVCAATDATVPAELDRLQFPPAARIFNPQPEQGMFSSIRAAAGWDGWKTDLAHFVVALGDQPHLRKETFRALLRQAAAQPEKIWQPSRRGQPHHPVVLPKELFLALRTTTAETLKEFLQGFPDRLANCECADPGLGFDIDTPADYERARAEFLRQT